MIADVIIEQILYQQGQVDFSFPEKFLDAEIVDELIHQMRNTNVIFRFGEAVERCRDRIAASCASGFRLRQARVN